MQVHFHHYGLATAAPDRATAFLRSLGYHIGETVADELQDVNLAMCTHDKMPAVEVIHPRGPEGPLSSVLETRGDGIYHVCLQTPNQKRLVDELKRTGNRIICISEPKPAILFRHMRVSFFMVTGFGLLEILERD